MTEAESERQLVEALEQAGRAKDIPFFTGKKYGTPGHPIPEPFEMEYSDGTHATHFAGRVDRQYQY